MTVGIPGAGIGGLFYLAAAVLLPLRNLIRNRGDRRAARSATVQAAIAVGIVASLWTTGWVLAALLGPDVARTSAIQVNGQPVGNGNVLHWAVFVGGYLLLGVILLGVQIARRVVGAERRLPVAARERPRLAGDEVVRPSGAHRRPSGSHREPAAAAR